MSVPATKAPCFAAATNRLPVPTKGSKTKEEGWTKAMLDMAKLISGSIEVLPMYFLFFKEKSSKVLRSPLKPSSVKLDGGRVERMATRVSIVIFKDVEVVLWLFEVDFSTKLKRIKFFDSAQFFLHRYILTDGFHGHSEQHSFLLVLMHEVRGKMNEFLHQRSAGRRRDFRRRLGRGEDGVFFAAGPKAEHGLDEYRSAHYLLK